MNYDKEGVPKLPQGVYEHKSKLIPTPKEQNEYDKAVGDYACGARSERISFHIKRFEELYPDLIAERGWYQR